LGLILATRIYRAKTLKEILPQKREKISRTGVAAIASRILFRESWEKKGGGQSFPYRRVVDHTLPGRSQGGGGSNGKRGRAEREKKKKKKRTNTGRSSLGLLSEKEEVDASASN